MTTFTKCKVCKTNCRAKVVHDKRFSTLSNILDSFLSAMATITSNRTNFRRMSLALLIPLPRLPRSVSCTTGSALWYISNDYILFPNASFYSCLFWNWCPRGYSSLGGIDPGQNSSKIDPVKWKKNEDSIARKWKLGRYIIAIPSFFKQKNYFHFSILIAFIVFLMSNLDNFDSVLHRKHFFHLDSLNYSEIPLVNFLLDTR